VTKFGHDVVIKK